MEFLIGNTLEGQGYPRLRRSDESGLPEFYDTAFINADADLAGIAESLAAARSGRLCLYGPPGTGKTAYGKWLADRLDLPLQTKRASDLLSMWVGESEKKIARTFRQAAEENALLMIDEVDSFLQDRRFPGVFIASTNLMRNLDQAALRRFDLKIKFDFMTCEQAANLLCRFCANANISAPGPDHLMRLARLRGLTPGDFAVMARRHRFHPFASCDALIEALEAECAIKEGPQAAIGFLQ
jgi:MoxR-like ATPase